MTVIASLTIEGVAKGKRYDVIDKSDKFVKILLDNGKIGIRSTNLFDVISLED